MLDEILAAGSTFDWISPLVGFAKDFLNGPSHTFLIPYTSGWSGRAVSRMLGKRGVKSWGYMVVKDTLTVSVAERQAGWAQYVLDEAGIPVENPAGGRRQAQATRHRKGNGFESLADDLRDVLDTSIF
jgi:hypothetical protein